MSTKIKLTFQEGIDLDFIQAGTKLRYIRLLSLIKFDTRDNWAKPREAIIDTGSPISLIPYSVWQELKIEILSPRKIKLVGIGAKETTTISGQLGKLKCILSDGKTASPVFSIKAYLVEDDSVPLLLGFEDVLTEIKLVSHYKEQNAYLEI